MYFTNQLFNWFYQTTLRDLVHQLNYVTKENRIYRKLVRKKRIILAQEDIQSLVRYGLPLGCQLKNIITIVSYSCWLRWKNRKYPQDKPKKRGRPPVFIYCFAGRIAEKFCSLDLKLAKLNFLHPSILVFYPIFCKDSRKNLFIVFPPNCSVHLVLLVWSEGNFFN